MNQSFSLIDLVLNASTIVQLVLLLLIIVSIASWAAIFGKISTIRKVKIQNEEFQGKFWSGTASLSDLCQYINTAKSSEVGPIERIFSNGMREYQKLREKRITEVDLLMDGTRRAMRASYQREMDELESHLAFLASVGSVSPYIGLFGTVWGIMHAFIGLGALTQVTLATVAPGIAEALIATAIGLFAAIPAVVAYNRFAREIDRIAIAQETFIEEFSNILQRNIGSQSTASNTAH